jgi:hypothetical protein
VQLKHEDVKGEESEDQKAIRALLASADDALDDKLPIDVIPIPITETDAYRQDVVDLPDEATLDDYARVPVSQFGAALLRGMGWTEGTAASRTKKGLVEPYLPEARPSLLGIGAKEREIVDDGSKRRKGNQKPERRYIPVIKKERESPGTDSARDGDRERSLSGTSSRRRSRSPRRPDSRRASPPAPRRNSRSPTRQDRDREVSERRSKKDSRRDYEGRNRDGQKDSRKSYVGNLELDGRERRKNQSPITNGDSNGRRRLD